MQQHIYPSHIMDLEMPHYPAKLTQNFEVEVEAYFEKISHNTQQIQNLQAMRDMLLKAIFA